MTELSLEKKEQAIKEFVEDDAYEIYDTNKIPKKLIDSTYDICINKHIPKNDEKLSDIELYYCGLYYVKMSEYKEQYKYYFLAAEKEYPEALFQVGVYYWDKRDREQAKKYYLKAIKKGSLRALHGMAEYYKELKQWKKMRKYYFESIKRGQIARCCEESSNASLMDLCYHYKRTKKYQKLFNLYDDLDTPDNKYDRKKMYDEISFILQCNRSDDTRDNVFLVDEIFRLRKENKQLNELLEQQNKEDN